MKGPALALPVLSCLLLAAHSLRLGDMGLAIAWTAMGGLVLAPRAWTRVAACGALAWGTYAWADAGLRFVLLRLALGQPWARLAAIMGAVTLLTAASAFLLLHHSSRRLHPLDTEHGPAKGGVFLLTAGLLGTARTMSPLPVLLADRYLHGLGWLEIFVLALYAVWIYGLMADPARAPRIRPRIWALFSAVFFAQLLLGLAGATDMLMTGSLHLPVPALIVAGPLYRGGGYFMPILFGAAVLLVGPAWCSHLCYIGAWDDQASRLRRSKAKPLPAWAGKARLASLVLVAASALALRLSGLPTAVAAWAAAGFGLGGVGVMLAASARLGRMAHCTAWCPMGLVAAVAGKLSPWRLTVAPGCDRCGKCSRACRYGALTPRDLERGRPGLSCTLCGDCVPACPGSLVGYRFPGLPPRRARAAFLVLVTALHACFLATARI